VLCCDLFSLIEIPYTEDVYIRHSRLALSVTPADERSPSLSGQHISETSVDRSGREPVISGIHSRVLADRRGAYIAGNLRGLLMLMSIKQLQVMRRWNQRLSERHTAEVAEMRDLLRSLDPGFSPVDEDHPVPYDRLLLHRTDMRWMYTADYDEKLSARLRLIYRLVDKAFHAAHFTANPSSIVHRAAYPSGASDTQRVYVPMASRSCISLKVCIENTTTAKALAEGYQYQLKPGDAIYFLDGPAGIYRVKEFIDRAQLRAAMTILQRGEDA